MPNFAHGMTIDQKGYLAVGEFMSRFALMEFQLDVALRSLLNLGLLEAHLINSNIDVRTKVYVVKAAVELRPIVNAPWLTQAKRDLEAIVKVAEKRNILAHTKFFPREEGVEFSHIKAKGKLALSDHLWTFEVFDDLGEQMRTLGDAVTTIATRVTGHFGTPLMAAIAETLGNAQPALRPSIMDALLLAAANRTNDDTENGQE